MIDKKEIFRWWNLFKSGKDLVEIRLLGKKTYSGYYKDINKLIADIERFDDDPDEQIYYTLNSIDDSCYGRIQSNKLVMNPKTTTNDLDIIGRNFVLVDLDPKRKTGVNSSQEELEYAHQKALEIYRFLMSNGFNEPIVCLSGNGYHINIPCKIAVSQETDELMKRFLAALSMLFSDERVEVDEKVFNRARISKLYGTTAKKGANLQERPHRMSRILKAPDEIKINDIEYFKKVADLYPIPDENTNRERYYSGESFDLDDFLKKHGVKVSKIESVAGGKKYILEHCVFDESHKGKDAVIFKSDNGALSYVCMHNSCRQYHWKEFRLHFEPDAYDKKDYKEFLNKTKYYSPQKIEVYKPKEESADKGKKWKSMKDIRNYDWTKEVFIPTGFSALDRAIRGLILGEVTLVSGLNGSGKSSWLNVVSANAIQAGFKVALWSGELVDFKLKNWINLVLAGKENVEPVSGCTNIYQVKPNIISKIDNWTEDKLFLYNNSYGNKYEQILHDMKEIIIEKGISLLIVDNLMALDIDGQEGSKYDKQKNFILEICALAKKLNVHIIMVAHPRKENTLLRKESISGTADLTNAVDNVILCHRVGEDFVKRASDFFGKAKASLYQDFSNVLEVCKNRSLGVIDFLVGTYYEVETKRFKNEKAEHICYGWQDYPKPASSIMERSYHTFNGYQQDTPEDMPFAPAREDEPLPF